MAVAGVLLAAAACAPEPVVLNERSGGDATRMETSRNSFGLPAPTLTNKQRRLFERGDSFFTQNWVTAPASTDARDGLGPTFNAQACSSCHVLDGRGFPPDPTGDTPRLGLLLRISVPGSDPVTGAPLPVPGYGDQLQDRSNQGIPAEGSVGLVYEDVSGTYADGTSYVLRKPTYTIEDPAFGPLPDDAMISPRLGPQLVGVGLLEAVPAEAVIAGADPDDEDGDGISGRPNMVWDGRTQRTVLGRFGWKANTSTIEQQVADAFLGDLGVTSDLRPDQNCPDPQTECAAAPTGGEPELTTSRLEAVTFYNRTLAVPAMRNTTDPEVLAGARIFRDIGCAACHTPTMHTGDSPVDALANQTIHPYTDLLLHDMGPGLADGRPDFLATGSEWRTPPLWGIGLIEAVNGQRFLLHDGRARDIAEAVLWHGGEAERPVRSFVS